MRRGESSSGVYARAGSASQAVAGQEFPFLIVRVSGFQTVKYRWREHSKPVISDSSDGFAPQRNVHAFAPFGVGWTLPHAQKLSGTLGRDSTGVFSFSGAAHCLLRADSQFAVR